MFLTPASCGGRDITVFLVVSGRGKYLIIGRLPHLYNTFRRENIGSGGYATPAYLCPIGLKPRFPASTWPGKIFCAVPRFRQERRSDQNLSIYISSPYRYHVSTVSTYLSTVLHDVNVAKLLLLSTVISLRYGACVPQWTQ